MIDFKGTLTDILTEMTVEIRDKYRQKLLKGDKMAKGTLHDNIEPNIDVNDISFTASLILPKHWVYVEKGRRKGAKQPPRDAIEQWIIDKGIHYGDERRLKGLAYYMARKIAKEGIMPTNYLEETVNEVWEKYRDEIDTKIQELAYGQVWEVLKNKF